MVMKGAKESSLKIRRVLSSDEGVYQCRADNAVGSVSGSVSLIVHGESRVGLDLLSLIENGNKMIKLRIKYDSRHFNGILQMKYETLQIYDCHITVVILRNLKTANILLPARYLFK